MRIVESDRMASRRREGKRISQDIHGRVHRPQVDFWKERAAGLGRRGRLQRK